MLQSPAEGELAWVRSQKVNCNRRMPAARKQKPRGAGGGGQLGAKDNASNDLYLTDLLDIQPGVISVQTNSQVTWKASSGAF